MFKRITSAAFSAMLMLCAVFVKAQTIMPMPIPVNSGCHLPPKERVAMVIVINAAIILGLFIRFMIIKKDKRFLYQSQIKNFFYELNDDSPEKQKDLSKYDWYIHCKPDFNFLMMYFFIVNLMAVIVSGYVALYWWLS